MEIKRFRRIGFVRLLVAGALLAVLAAPTVSSAEGSVCFDVDGDLICYVIVGPKVVQDACRSVSAAWRTNFHKGFIYSTELASNVADGALSQLQESLPPDRTLDFVYATVRHAARRGSTLYFPEQMLEEMSHAMVRGCNLLRF